VYAAEKLKIKADARASQLGPLHGGVEEDEREGRKRREVGPRRGEHKAIKELGYGWRHGWKNDCCGPCIQYGGRAGT
jgi:hypothetical protein